MRLSCAAFASIVLAGCASQPVTTATPPAGAVASLTPAATAPAIETAPAAAGKTAAAGTTNRKVPAGYKIVQRDGVKLFCKKTVTLGSRFPKEICMTDSEYVEFEARNEGMRQDLRKSIGICGVGSCSGSE